MPSAPKRHIFNTLDITMERNRQALNSWLAGFVFVLIVAGMTGCGKSSFYHIKHYQRPFSAIAESNTTYFHSSQSGKIIEKDPCEQYCEPSCYGYEPTCWTHWPAECETCPVQGEVLEEVVQPMPYHDPMPVEDSPVIEPSGVKESKQQAAPAQPATQPEAPEAQANPYIPFDDELRIPALRVPSIPADVESAVPSPSDSTRFDIKPTYPTFVPLEDAASRIANAKPQAFTSSAATRTSPAQKDSAVATTATVASSTGAKGATVRLPKAEATQALPPGAAAQDQAAKASRVPSTGVRNEPQPPASPSKQLPAQPQNQPIHPSVSSLPQQGKPPTATKVDIRSLRKQVLAKSPTTPPTTQSTPAMTVQQQPPSAPAAPQAVSQPKVLPQPKGAASASSQTPKPTAPAAPSSTPNLVKKVQLPPSFLKRVTTVSSPSSTTHAVSTKPSSSRRTATTPTKKPSNHAKDAKGEKQAPSDSYLSLIRNRPGNSELRVQSVATKPQDKQIAIRTVTDSPTKETISTDLKASIPSKPERRSPSSSDLSSTKQPNKVKAETSSTAVSTSQRAQEPQVRQSMPRTRPHAASPQQAVATKKAPQSNASSQSPQVAMSKPVASNSQLQQTKVQTQPLPPAAKSTANSALRVSSGSRASTLRFAPTTSAAQTGRQKLEALPGTVELRFHD